MTARVTETPFISWKRPFQIHSVEKQAQNNPMGGADRHSLSLRDFHATNDTAKAISHGPDTSLGHLLSLRPR